MKVNSAFFTRMLLELFEIYFCTKKMYNPRTEASKCQHNHQYHLNPLNRNFVDLTTDSTKPTVMSFF